MEIKYFKEISSFNLTKQNKLISNSDIKAKLTLKIYYNSY